MRRRTYVAVIGAGDATAAEIEQAEEVGRLLARSGAVLVCGGLGGVMHAAARGAQSEGGVSISIEWKEFGVRLKFLPTVLDSNRIRLMVAPEVSAPDESRAVLLGGYLVPGIVTRRASTTVEMGDKDVLVIGGLKQTDTVKRVKKFPILGDIPIVNLAFKHSKTEKITRDLVIAVSPSIIRAMAKSFPSPLPGEDTK